MAYVAPVAVSDGNALSAANLNALSDAVEYLYGIASAPQVAMNRIYTEASVTTYLAFQYLHDYMHVEYFFSGGTSGQGGFKIEIYDDDASWKLMLEDTSPSRTVNNIAWVTKRIGGFDVGTDAIGDDPYMAGATTIENLTSGGIYELRITIDKDDATYVSVPYIINADAASL